MAEETSGRRDNWDGMRALFHFAVWAFVIICLIVVGGLVALFFYASTHEGRNFGAVLAPFASTALNDIPRGIAPVLQLFVVLIIIEWFLKRIGFTFSAGDALKAVEWNTQTLVALIVIVAFAIAALGGITEGLGALKDVALVVVGFYFGTQRRTVEIDTRNSKIVDVSEHTNDRETVTNSPPPANES